jgi:hypothetical protein
MTNDKTFFSMEYNKSTNNLSVNTNVTDDKDVSEMFAIALKSDQRLRVVIGRALLFLEQEKEQNNVETSN